MKGDIPVGTLDSGHYYYLLRNESDKSISLYHYSDLDATLSILENQQLWLTNSVFLNDNEEMHEGVNTLLNATEQSLMGKMDKSSSEIFAGQMRQFLSELLSEENVEPCYIVSFSEQADLLSQWRGYGMFCIEFDSSYIPSMRCVYSQDDKINLALKALNEVYDKFESTLLKSGNGELSPDVVFWVYHTLMRASLSMKNTGFVEEKEHRMAISFADSGPVQFRTKGDIVIPYVAWDIDTRAIKAIHIGPVKNKDITYKSLENYLLHKRKANPEKYEHIKIVQSQISYRG